MAPGPNGLLVPLSEGFNESHEDVEEQSFRGGVLDVRIHDAQGIHNICIYDKQDVFAKFSFTHGKGEPFCTQVITKGGKNPVFNESFQLPVTLPNSVLKCEMWMSSRAHSYLEDQLLGFVLVPLLSLTGKNGVPEEYGLSSTELFHSPAGVVRLTLVFREGSYSDGNRVPESAQSQSNSPVNGSPSAVRINGKHTFIKVFEDGHGNSSGSESPTCYESDDIERIEFPDLQAASEDQQLVSSYLQMSSTSKECIAKDVAGSGIITGPQFLFEAKQKPDEGVVINSFNHRGGDDSSEKDRRSSSPSSSELASSSDDQSDNTSGSGSVKQYCSDKEKNSASGFGTKPHSTGKQDSSLSSLTQESPVMQQQIVDMYMKSMQQFTEALAKMQLPLDLDKAESSPNAKKSKSHQETEDSGKKHGSKTHRVFYGSRAFF